MDHVVKLNLVSGDRHQGTSFSGSLMGAQTTFDLLHKGVASKRASSMGSFQAQSWFFQDSLGKTPEDGGPEQKRATEDEMVGWRH